MYSVSKLKHNNLIVLSFIKAVFDRMGYMYLFNDIPFLDYYIALSIVLLFQVPTCSFSPNVKVLHIFSSLGCLFLLMVLIVSKILNYIYDIKQYLLL